MIVWSPSNINTRAYWLAIAIAIYNYHIHPYVYAYEVAMQLHYSMHAKLSS